MPGSSATTNTSTGPSSSLVPDTQVTVAQRARASRSPTTAKSVTDQPGLIGQGRYVGKPVGRAQVVGERVVRHVVLAAGSHSVRTSPWTGQDVGVAGASCSTSARQRGQPAGQRHGSTVVSDGDADAVKSSRRGCTAVSRS